jgi:hypothetical protein
MWESYHYCFEATSQDNRRGHLLFLLIDFLLGCPLEQADRKSEAVEISLAYSVISQILYLAVARDSGNRNGNGARASYTLLSEGGRRLPNQQVDM